VLASSHSSPRRHKRSMVVLMSAFSANKNGAALSWAAPSHLEQKTAVGGVARGANDHEWAA
jgi:hypothetical protein